MKPTYWLLMWSNGLELEEFRYRGKEIDLHQFLQLKNTYHEDVEKTMFNGSKAVVQVVTIVQGITRSQKLKFAEDFMKGNYKSITVDLDRCIGIEVPGIVHSDLVLEKTPPPLTGGWKIFHDIP